MDNKLFERAKVNCGNKKAMPIIEGHRHNTKSGHNILTTTSPRVTMEFKC